MPVFGRRSPPLDEGSLDVATLRELERVVGERVVALEAFGTCPACGHAELRALLARIRGILEPRRDR
jgi:hypothetical protein